MFQRNSLDSIIVVIDARNYVVDIDVPLDRSLGFHSIDCLFISASQP